MKYLKKFEDEIAAPFFVGDYVICVIDDYSTYPELIDFLKNNVGQITSLRDDSALVKYLNAPENIKQYCLVYNDITNACTYMVNYKYLRLATPDEIEHQKLKDSAHKYNL